MAAEQCDTGAYKPWIAFSARLPVIESVAA
jgi:hypothetical protein